MVTIIWLILLLCIGVVVWTMVQTFRERNRNIEHRVGLPWPPDASSAHVSSSIADLMQRQGFRLTSQGPAGIVYTREYRSAWLLIPCILFFPIGLLSLLFKSHTDINFTAAPTPDGGSTVAVVGRGSRYVRDRIGAVLMKLAQPQAPVQ